METVHTNGNGTTTTNGKDLPRGPLTLTDRSIIKKGSKPGQLATLHLEEVRDTLAKMTKLQDPVDFERALDQLHVDFSSGKMVGRFLTPNGPSPEAMLVSDTGSHQLAREVLPTRFFGGMKELAEMDEQGGKLATMVWAKFSRKETTPRKVRTINMRLDDGKVVRVIRSCHSQGYAPYSNLEFVEDILNNAGNFASMPVLDWRVDDSVMRLRFAGCESGQIEVNKPVPMVEAWNSEVGMRRVGLRGGMFRLICTNGMGSWQDKTEYNWIHRGDAQRIKSGVQSAFQNLLTVANGVVDAYTAALGISIDDAYAWMAEELEGRTSQRVIEAAKQGLNDPTTTKGGSLASVVDSLTLIAQSETSMLGAYEIERMAAELLRKGQAVALRNGGRITATV